MALPQAIDIRISVASGQPEWPVKLQMTDRPVCSGYVAVHAD